MQYKNSLMCKIKKIKNIILLLKYKSNNTRIHQNIQEYKITKLLKQLIYVYIFKKGK